jgi:branched-chain amino acid transport system substrate-binding protein
MSTALTGPSNALGLAMRVGVEAYFQQVNDENNGVFGRPLRLVVLDDQYEPLQTGPNMRSLIDDHGVFAVLGNVGTPTAAVAVAIANEKKNLFFGAFTGSGILRADSAPGGHRRSAASARWTSRGRRSMRTAR